MLVSIHIFVSTQASTSPTLHQPPTIVLQVWSPQSKVLRRTKRQSRAQSPKLFAERSGKAERKAQSSKFKVQSSKLNVRFFLSYNKGFRLPTFTDLYYKSPTHEGNQGMRAEESHSVQAGATLKMTRGESVSSAFTLKAFYHRGHNLIDWVMYAPDDVYHSANFDLDNIGFQAQTTINVLPPQRGAGRPLTLHLSYAFLHQHRRDDTPVYKSNYAMEYLRHKLVATFDHPVWSHLTASWSLRWQERMGSYLLYEDAQSTGRLVPYDPYATLDLKLRWTARHYELWAEATNLTNRHYYDLGNIPQPGIVILGGIRLRL